MIGVLRVLNVDIQAYKLVLVPIQLLLMVELIVPDLLLSHILMRRVYTL